MNDNPTLRCLGCGAARKYLGFTWAYATRPIPGQPGRTTEVRVLICPVCKGEETRLIEEDYQI